jgi:FkbM family methyltransferase
LPEYDTLPPPPHHSKNQEKPIIVYSCGIGLDISFDYAIMNKHNAEIFAFDPTPKSIEWIKKQEIPSNFHFFPYDISSKSGTEKMYLPSRDDQVSGSIFYRNKFVRENSINTEMRSLEDIARENNHSFIDILKMDIEGSEFQVIETLDFSKLIFGQILIEFHQRFFPDGKNFFKKAIKILQDNGYVCFAISYSEYEYSFINKRKYEELFR